MLFDGSSLLAVQLAATKREDHLLVEALVHEVNSAKIAVFDKTDDRRETARREMVRVTLMRPATFGILVVGAVLSAGGLVEAQPAAEPMVTKPGPTPKDKREGRNDATSTVRLDVKRAVLDNGLRVVLVVDHTSPTVAIDLVYDVGARDEERGRAGFAHLFEHMMFQGSANVGRGDHFKLITGHGGTTNGTTNEDRTRYYDVLPSGELALGLWLEADRMKTLDVSQKNFESQRAVVKEEYRMRVENAAYGPASIRLQELAYQGYWPYEHPAIGAMRDLDSAALSWVWAFHDDFYAPNGAVLAIAGDVDEAEAMTLVRKYFAGARRKTTPRVVETVVPEQASPRTTMLEDIHAKLPAFFMGWVGPPSYENDHYALELAANLLGDGESSRLHRLLVRERSMAVQASARTDGLRGPDLFQVVVKLASGARLEAVEKLVLTEVADLANVGPSREEMTKAKTRAQAAFLLGLQSNGGKAAALAELELFRGDATTINGELEKYMSVTQDDIKRVVRKYLSPHRRSVVEVKPGRPTPSTGRADTAGDKR